MITFLDRACRDSLNVGLISSSKALPPSHRPGVLVESHSLPSLPSPSLSQNTVDKLIKKTNLALVIGTHSWREQFLEAVTVSAGKLRGQGESEGR